MQSNVRELQVFAGVLLGTREDIVSYCKVPERYWWVPLLPYWYHHCIGGCCKVPLVGAVCKQEVGNKQRWPLSVIAAASSSIAIAIYCNLLNCKLVTMNCSVMRFLDCICSLLKQLKLCIEVSLLQGNATLCIKLKLTVNMLGFLLIFLFLF